MIGAVSWLFGTRPAAGVRGLAALGAASLAFFVSLLALASLLRALGGGRFYLRTRTACPGCGRTLFIIQTRCSFCDASVPVAGPALPTFGMVVAAWAVFECVWFLLS